MGFSLLSLWCKFWNQWPQQCGEALVSPDHHFLHLKGVAVFCKSTIPLCSNALKVMSPHILVWLLLILFSWASVQRLPLLSLQEAHTLFWYFLWAGSYGHLICVWTWDTVPRGCVQVRVIHILPWWLWVWWGLVPSGLWASCYSPIFQINGGPSWTRGGLVGSCPHCSKLGPASSTNWACFYHPNQSCVHS